MRTALRGVHGELGYPNEKNGAANGSEPVREHTESDISFSTSYILHSSAEGLKIDANIDGMNGCDDAKVAAKRHKNSSESAQVSISVHIGI